MKVLFSSANCLLDPSSGAAISVKTILELLQARGVVCKSLTGSVFDRAASPDNTQNLRSAGAKPLDPTAPLNSLWVANEGGVEHFVVPLARSARVLQSRADEGRLLIEAQQMLDRFKPDVVLTYGGGLFERNLVHAAEEQGAATVFYLGNPGYQSLSSFAGIDHVVFDTEATRSLYKQRLDLDGTAIGKFILPPKLGADRAADAVLFVNPAPEKGVTLFYRIAELAARITPEVKFLVVESRSTLDTVQQRTGIPFSRMPNIERTGLQRHMGDVFSRAKVLLQPSVWHESGARTAIEAMSLGIPVVATDTGGIPEVLGEAGIVIPPPEPLRMNHWLIPPMSMAIPWVEALRQLYQDPDFYEEHRQLAGQAWARHEPSARLTRLISLFEDLARLRKR